MTNFTYFNLWHTKFNTKKFPDYSIIVTLAAGGGHGTMPMHLFNLVSLKQMRG